MQMLNYNDGTTNHTATAEKLAKPVSNNQFLLK